MDLDLELFADDANMTIHYQPLSSVTYQFHTFHSIIIDSRLPHRQQRVELAHELGHVLLHVGRQDFMNDDFRTKQEWQAERFGMYSLAPTTIIKENLIVTSSRSRLIVHLSDVFEVPEPFMETRLNLLEERLRFLASEAQMMNQINEIQSMYDYAYRHPTNQRIAFQAMTKTYVLTSCNKMLHSAYPIY